MFLFQREEMHSYAYKYALLPPTMPAGDARSKCLNYTVGTLFFFISESQTNARSSQTEQEITSSRLCITAATRAAAW